MRHILALIICCSSLGFLAHADWDAPAGYDPALEDFYLDLAGTSIRSMASRDVGDAAKKYSGKVKDCGRGLAALRVLVSRAGLTVEGGGAHFSDGSSKTMSFGRTFSAGYVSPWIDAAAFGFGSRCVTSVFVIAHSAVAGQRSHVEVQGRFATLR